MRRFALAGLLVALTACESSKALPQKTVANPAGTVTWSVGSEVGQLPFANVECAIGDTLEFKLRGTQELTGPDFRAVPYVLIARLGRDGASGAHTPELGASLFIPNHEFEGKTYPMMQLIAQAVPGVPSDANCNVESKGAAHHLICTNARVIPWLVPSDVPLGRFKTDFVCPTATSTQR